MASKRTRMLTPPADRDGDSTMHSSPSNDDDEMFPDEALPNNPSTPLNAPLTLAAAELSPPNSQSQARDTSNPTLGVNANGKRPLSQAQMAANLVGGGGKHQDAETGYQWTKQEEQPGWEWKNSRAREEEARALDTIVDLGSQIKSE